MKNIKITNMENGSVIVVTKDIFNSMKNNLSEQSVYEETNEKLTIEQLIVASRQINNRGAYALLRNLFEGELLLQEEGAL